MYAENTECGRGLVDDFSNALALLRSDDENSAEKCRDMLDTLIARRYGPSRTLAARICNDPTSALSRLDEAYRRAMNTKRIERFADNTTNHTNDGERKYDVEIAKTRPNTISDDEIERQLIADSTCFDRNDIPTISIPDEYSANGEGELCKICNGANIGPLILLECQECQDVYHPLCHQPPVLDLDIYDPRLVWHCAKCVELADSAAAITTVKPDNEKEQTMVLPPKIHKPRSHNKTIRNNFEAHAYFRRAKDKTDGKKNKNKNKNKNATRDARQQPSIGSTVESTQRRKRSLPVSQPGSSISGLNLRKRVGSKLTILRTTAK